MTAPASPGEGAGASRLRPGARAQRLRRSLGLRLMLLFVLLALATAAVFTGGMRRALAGGWSELVRPLLSDYVDRLAAEIGSPPDPARADALARRLPLRIRIDGPRLQWDSAPPAQRDREAADRRRFAPEHDDHGGRDGRDDGAERLLTRTSADGHRITFGISRATWEGPPRLVGSVTLALLLGLTVLAYLATRRLFRPIDDIRAGALRFGHGDFDTPIPQRRDDELGELARQVNTMAEALRGMLEAKRALLLAVSHELRSPLTRARLNAELVPEGAARDALLHDLAEMRDLIADLLEGERLAAGHAALQREPTDIDALVRELVAASFAELPLGLDLQAGSAPVMLDRTRLRLLLRNLLDNTRRHAGGAVQPARLSSRREAGGLVLTLRDHGPGVESVALQRLAEPFYRPDAARTRSAGGVGLGLHLARLVAQAHGGQLDFANAAPGLEVRLWLPQAPAAT